MTGSTGANLPGQLSRLCGQEIHVAWCGAHSAGIEKPRAAGVSWPGVTGLGSRIAEDLEAKAQDNKPPASMRRQPGAPGRALSAPSKEVVVSLTAYKVWDRMQRVFHWVNFLAIVTLAAIGTVILNADRIGIPDDPGMVTLKTLHVSVGYVFILNLLWRLVWAFIGGPFARWRALLPGGRGFGRRLAGFIKGFIAGRAPFYLGHNPPARILLSLLVLLLVVQGATGLMLAGTDVYMPPFGGAVREWVAAESHDPALVRPYAPDTVNAEAYAEMRAVRGPIVDIHEYNFYILLTLIAFHIAAAVVAEFREGGTVISAMFTGRKIDDGIPVDLEYADDALREAPVSAATREPVVTPRGEDDGSRSGEDSSP
jgi:cytochrome b